MFDTFYRLLLHLLDDGLDFLVGYTTRFGWRLDREIAASTFEKSAQIVRIVGRGAYSLSDTLKLDRNFILFHEAYVHPEYVPKTESNATMYGFTETHAYFCVADDGVDIADTKVRTTY